MSLSKGDLPVQCDTHSQKIYLEVAHWIASVLLLNSHTSQLHLSPNSRSTSSGILLFNKKYVVIESSDMILILK